MKIAILVEGETELGFKVALRKFLEPRLSGKMPNLDFDPCRGRIPKAEKLRRVVEDHLRGRNPADAVIALTDVYTGTNDFTDAADAKAKMRAWVGPNAKFHPHAAQHDFEAWLLPYWDTIQKLAGHNKAKPSGAPETVNHQNSPAYRITEIFRLGKIRDFDKRRDAARILADNDLLVAANACPELKAFLNTILKLCDGELIA